MVLLVITKLISCLFMSIYFYSCMTLQVPSTVRSLNSRAHLITCMHHYKDYTVVLFCKCDVGPQGHNFRTYNFSLHENFTKL